MTDGQKKSVEEVAKQAQLAQIVLKSSSSDCRIPAGSMEPSKVAVDARSSYHWLRTSNDSGLYCFLVVEVEGVGSADTAAFKEGENVFLVKATFVVSYALVHSEFSDEALDSFCERTVNFIIHPYFREFVDSTMKRMGIPPYVLPLLKASALQKEKVVSSQTEPKVQSSPSSST